MNLNRLELLIGQENLKKINKLNILIIGLGGVGGYTLESLVRSGIEKLTIVDGDIIKTSNLNRQIISNSKNINKYKTKEFKKRIKLINPNAKIRIINKFITEEDLYLLFMENYDYIIDSCDDVRVKIALINECYKRKIKIVSSMGTANKLCGEKLSITTLDKTSYDPLAKKIRKSIDLKVQKKVKVISSTEMPKIATKLGSTSYVPAIAGLLITNYIIKDTIS